MKKVAMRNTKARNLKHPSIIFLSLSIVSIHRSNSELAAAFPVSLRLHANIHVAALD